MYNKLQWLMSSLIYTWDSIHLSSTLNHLFRIISLFYSLLVWTWKQNNIVIYFCSEVWSVSSVLSAGWASSCALLCRNTKWTATRVNRTTSLATLTTAGCSSTRRYNWQITKSKCTGSKGNFSARYIKLFKLI